MKKKLVIVSKNEKSEDKEGYGVGGEDSVEGGLGFEQMYERTLNLPEVGEIVEGEVARVDEKDIFIDIRCKTEGRMMREDFEGEVEIGDWVKVMVMKIEDEEGNILVSQREADRVLGLKYLEEEMGKERVVDGKVKKKIRGGYLVNIHGLSGFLPDSQVSLRGMGEEGLDHVGKEYHFKVERYEREEENLVLSRRAYLEEERKLRRKEFFEGVGEGDIVKGRVKNVLSYGGFIDIGGFLDGFVHIRDLSWEVVGRSGDVLKVGLELELRVLNINRKEEKLGLGLKQMGEDPWLSFCREKRVGEVVYGEVVRLIDYGAFVKVGFGVEGLLHIDELSWTRKVRHPRDFLQVGDRIKMAIKFMEGEGRKLLLSLKQVLNNPWETAKEEYPKGKRVKGKVKGVVSFGVFVGLKNDLTGLLHISEIDWIKKDGEVLNQSIFRRGSEIEVVILEVNEKQRTISLSLKQLLENPWEVFAANHGVGSHIRGKVNRIVGGGLVLDVGEGLEGFLPEGELMRRREGKEGKEGRSYGVGDELDVLVKGVNGAKSQLRLSEKDYEEKESRKILAEYVIKEKKDKVSLGDLLKFKDIRE